MPGLVSVRPSPAPPILNILDTENGTKSPIPKSTLLASPSPAKPFKTTAQPDEAPLQNPDLGPFLLKLARDTMALGDNPNKALDYAIRASKSFEMCLGPNLELAMSLHMVAAIYTVLGRFKEALPVLERSIEVVDSGNVDHALTKFSGYMQLGDTYSMLGQLDKSILCYRLGLNVQMEVLGDSDPRVAETCRYLAEAHVQALQFDEAETLCNKALEIHRENSAPASLAEAADRRLMALVCEAKGDHDSALEHLVLASMSMIANGQDNEVAAIDISIGDIYLSLCHFDEAIFAYQKALTIFKSTKGENHSSVATVFIRLADLYYKSGMLRESKSYCESALRIYAKPLSGTAIEEIVNGLTEISAMYDMLDEPEEALKLLQKAVKLLEDHPWHVRTVAGLQSQMGVILHHVGSCEDAWKSFNTAVTMLQACGENGSTFFGIVLNQMGLACLQLYKITEAAKSFEEALDILEQEYGSYHLDTLGVYSNLAATYDAMGRVEDAIQILEYILEVREEKLGTANPDFDNEKKRLAQLYREVGKAKNRSGRTLENLLDTNSQREGTKGWSKVGLGI